jgi:hypothetical protein
MMTKLNDIPLNNNPRSGVLLVIRVVGEVLKKYFVLSKIRKPNTVCI